MKTKKIIFYELWVFCDFNDLKILDYFYIRAKNL